MLVTAPELSNIPLAQVSDVVKPDNDGVGTKIHSIFLRPQYVTGEQAREHNGRMGKEQISGTTIQSTTVSTDPLLPLHTLIYTAFSCRRYSVLF